MHDEPEARAGDWWEARKRGERLPVHELPDPEHCDLCGERMDPAALNAAAYEACGFHVCTDCLEACL